MSECLMTGFHNEDGEVVLCVPARLDRYIEDLARRNTKATEHLSVQDKNGLASHRLCVRSHCALPMHAGQTTSLADVVRHYVKTPGASAGHTELKALALSESEVQDLVTVRGTLTARDEPDPARH